MKLERVSFSTEPASVVYQIRKNGSAHAWLYNNIVEVEDPPQEIESDDETLVVPEIAHTTHWEADAIHLKTTEFTEEYLNEHFDELWDEYSYKCLPLDERLSGLNVADVDISDAIAELSELVSEILEPSEE